jgi:hypothetical protein
MLSAELAAAFSMAAMWGVTVMVSHLIVSNCLLQSWLTSLLNLITLVFYDTEWEVEFCYN